MSHATRKIRILVAFGDISGFTEFVDAITDDAREYDPLMDEYDRLVKEAKTETGYHFNQTGDGFMAWLEISNLNPGKLAVKFLLDLYALLKKVEDLFDKRREKFVSPSGFRIVGATGYVKLKIEDGEEILRGKHINKAHNALDEARGHGLVCDISLRRLISDALAKRNRISFESFGKYLWVMTVNDDASRLSSRRA